MNPGARALARLAVREVRSTPLRHLLVVTLIALAVAAAVGASVGVRTYGSDPDQRQLRSSGEAQVVVDRRATVPGPGALSPAAVAEVERRFGDVADLGVTDTARATEALRDALPDSATIVPERRSLVDLDGWAVEVLAVDVTAPLVADRFVVDGPAPGRGEALASGRLLADLGADVGDRIAVEGATVTVVGTVRRLVGQDLTGTRDLVVAPGTTLGSAPLERWSIGGLSSTDLAGYAAGTVPITDVVRDLSPAPTAARPEVSVAFPSPEGRAAWGYGPAAIGSAVGAVLLLQVGFVAAAAFATGARRRVRRFGLLAAGGASPGHLRALVLVEAAVLGTVGAVVGAVVGVAAVRLGLPLLTVLDGDVRTALVFSVRDLAPAALGPVAAIAAAWFPARSVAAAPLGAALAGRAPARRVPTWVTPASVIAVILGTVGVSLASEVGDETVTIVAFALLLGGVAGLAAPIVELGGRVAGRLPFPVVRSAVRDSARQRTRSAATIAAITVALTVPVVLGSGQIAEARIGNGGTSERTDLAVVTGPAYADLHLAATDDVVAEAAAVVGPLDGDVALPVLIESNRGDGLRVRVDETRGRSFAIGIDGRSTTNGAYELTPELADALDAPVAPGTVVADLPGVGLEPTVTAGQVRHGRGDAVDVDIVATSLGLHGPLAGTVFLAPDVADALGLAPVTEHRLLTLSRPTTVDDLTGATLPYALQGERGTLAVAPSVTGSSPVPTIAWSTGAALLVAFAIAAAVGALAATETDRDLATMSSIGADPRTRPRFRAIQTGYHVAIAAVLAVVVGALALGAGAAVSTITGAVPVPWPVLATLAVAPVLVAAPFRVASRIARPATGRRPT